MLDENKLKEAFPNTTVFKDQNLIATFKAASIPAFLRDWILKKKAGVDGRIHDKDELRQYMNAIIPRREDVLEIKDSARATGASKKFLARMQIRFSNWRWVWTIDLLFLKLLPSPLAGRLPSKKIYTHLKIARLRF